MALRCIGKGNCGSVWTKGDDSDDAIKREDMDPRRSIHNDYIMQTRVLSKLDPSKSNCPALVPSCRRYVAADDHTWWTENSTDHLPEDTQICNTLISERIKPFPQPTRNILIDTFCPTQHISTLRTSIPDRDCLIRPYLGRRRLGNPNSRFNPFKLRNHPLHIDQMEELGLPTETYAKIIAGTLAFLYFTVGIDANDMEFVLAPRRTVPDGHEVIHSDAIGDHVVWILDFDLCRPITQDEAGVKQAAAAFLTNDPFFPLPGKEDERDKRLWDVFQEEFLRMSKEAGEAGGLVGMWVENVVRMKEGKDEERRRGDERWSEGVVIE